MYKLSTEQYNVDINSSYFISMLLLYSYVSSFFY